MLKNHCFERTRLQPRRKRHIYIVALATEGISFRPHHTLSAPSLAWTFITHNNAGL
jgi:hypothetical protein